LATPAQRRRSSDGLAVLDSAAQRRDFGIPPRCSRNNTSLSAQCPYCSNPVELERGGNELRLKNGRAFSPTRRIACCKSISPAAAHRAKDLVELVQRASDVGLYSNLITSAVLLTKERLGALPMPGCVTSNQFQGNEPVVADRVAGFKRRARKKIEVAQ